VSVAQYASQRFITKLQGLLLNKRTIGLIVREGEHIMDTTRLSADELVSSIIDDTQVDMLHDTKLVQKNVVFYRVQWNNSTSDNLLTIPRLAKEGVTLCVEAMENALASPLNLRYSQNVPQTLMLLDCNLKQIDYGHVFGNGVCHVVIHNCDELQHMCKSKSQSADHILSLMVSNISNPHALLFGVFANVQRSINITECTFQVPVINIHTEANFRIMHCTFENQDGVFQVTNCGKLLFLAHIPCNIVFGEDIKTKVEGLAVIACEKMNNPCPIIFQFKDSVRVLFYEHHMDFGLSKVCGQSSDTLEVLVLQNIGVINHIINAPKLKTLILADSSVTKNGIVASSVKNVFLLGEKANETSNQQTGAPNAKYHYNPDAFGYDKTVLDACGSIFQALTLPW
jgi:hypothetical protein